MIKQIANFIDSKENEIFELLKTIVNMDSYSHDKESVNRVGKVLCQSLDSFDISYVEQSNEKYGDFIIATLKGSKPGKILLLGHRDTPHAVGTVKKRPYYEDGTYAYGPGVSDMKAGLVSMIYAAAAIRPFKEELCDIELLITPDEECGSPVSRKVIEERAKGALAVFNLESGRPDGSVVTARKGSAHLHFEIEGKAAHAGVFIEEGISAIDELAYKIIELRKLMDLEKGRTINVGTVTGGSNSNVVAPEAKGSIHIGFWTLDDFESLLADIREVINTSYVPGTKASLEGGLGILPMERHEGVVKLYDIVRKAAKQFDISITEKKERGAADAGFTASLGIPTICGMGPIGGKWHSKDEYMLLKSFLPRIKMLAASIILTSNQWGNERGKLAKPL
ncbi:M20 family metallopeptidase [Neobacillus kokaensis]|uniref:Peptidase M20 n=1 Tax=Neobacillus kokaensis TaxID=2759023 RepID=A0ABQ3N688_9BACI|nr:M20 family metallopeptidase [Neobacillus kokaensis]GHH99375.1 peptidase M20 [Neobacillus kokaensis]